MVLPLFYEQERILIYLITKIKFINFANFMHYVILQTGILYYNKI